jgi:hypothetical protein
VVALVIFAMSVKTLWEAAGVAGGKKIVGKLLTILSRDVESNISFINLSLDGIIDGLTDSEIQQLPADTRNRLLLDRPLSASFTGSILLFNANGDLVAKGGSSRGRPLVSTGETSLSQFITEVFENWCAWDYPVCGRNGHELARSALGFLRPPKAHQTHNRNQERGRVSRIDLQCPTSATYSGLILALHHQGSCLPGQRHHTQWIERR